MKITVLAKPLARADKVEKISETEYKVSVKEPPLEGRANRAIVRTLAEYFKISTSRIRIVSGQTYRQKVVEILP
ncbi:MAG: DUF167 domain-containing protein [Parcubacteria group bacterium]|nr:DUF167 domain-containing protein [Parcubacteria group bacterium]